MAKEKKKVKVVVTDASGGTVATIEPRYKTLPVDYQTYQGVLRLCEARGLNKRSQGVIVRQLVMAELAKLPAEPKAM